MAMLISIIGPVCVGKTTLAEKLAESLPARLLREDYASNPFLAESYASPQGQTALAAQLYFLFSRTQQMASCNIDPGEWLVSDYGFAQDGMFARLKLSTEEWNIYHPLSAEAQSRVLPPTVLVHLDAPTEVLMERIVWRGRDFEATFTTDFLDDLRQANANITPPPGCKIVRVDTHKIDFREDEPFEKLLETIRPLIG